MRTTAHRDRETQRDLLFTNAEVPAPKGEPHSSVSADSLTRLAHQRLSATGQTATQAATLDPSIRAGMPPPLRPGQARTPGTGERRPGNGSTPGLSSGKDTRDGGRG
ncbi:hypothetical protein GCM10009630_29450 [Kribbella jejuensis]|uniref:Uncharacterized protein n=1 Tax=Kribbella jejuensis TaxID=236068 RepID=A0A542EQ18_9ACTN|nr:hypothetical protein [Kribbella jejuensis]TQJ17447.1 hypothetical protein FB475_1565 [Kribbella jejuensis]